MSDLWPADLAPLRDDLRVVLDRTWGRAPHSHADERALRIAIAAVARRLFERGVSVERAIVLTKHCLMESEGWARTAERHETWLALALAETLAVYYPN